MEKIRPGLFRVKVPLPGNPLKYTNSYIIRGPERDLVVDTGMNRSACKRALRDAFRQLELDPEHTDFFATHFHADHAGLIPELASDQSAFYIGQRALDALDSSDYWDKMPPMARRNGFPESEVEAVLEAHPGRKYDWDRSVRATGVADGDRLTIGDYSFRCITTPGHSRGHTCLYEPDQRILLSGDHVLGDITPNISALDPSDNPLRQFLQSLEKVQKLEVELVLPGHRSIFTHFRERIEELKNHHQERAEEALAIVERAKTDPSRKTAYAVATQMHWDMRYDTWDDFPVMQKWFALGETLAHLEYLYGETALERRQVDQQVIYELQG